MALGTRRGKGAAAQPIGAAAGAHPTVSPPRSAFLFPLFPDLEAGALGRERAGGSGVHSLGQGWRPAGEDALTHSGQLHPFGQSRIGWWWVVGR